ncbi:MAG: hypothetical protein IT406_02630 [Candidatus Yanofskybacteria bacterium]|nr:hypothetical protein [Candidatus Yanofskybacteria bacterium]
MPSPSLDLTSPPAQVPPPVMLPEPRRASSNVLLIVALAVLVLAAAVYVGMWLRSDVPVETETPTPTPVVSASQIIPSGWTRFNSRYFSLSFDVPPGYEVYDSQNVIAVSKGPYEIPDIGGTNAFFQIDRFTATYSKERAIANWNLDPVKNASVTKGSIVVDGSTFTVFEGAPSPTAYTYDAGREFFVVFDASLLRIVEHPQWGAKDYDGYTIGKQILTTLRFSSSAGWETYTNTTGLFSVKVPAGFRSDERYAPNLFLTQVNTTGTTMANVWDIEIGSPEPAPACATDAACFQILNASFQGSKEAGSPGEFREVTTLIDGRAVKGFEAWGSGSVRYVFPLSVSGKYFTLMFQIGNTGDTTAPTRLLFFSSAQEIAATFTVLK